MEIWTCEYSPKQRSFHVDTLERVLETNRRTAAGGLVPGYVILCVAATSEDADWFAEQQARREYQESPIVKTIKKLLEQFPDGWSGTAQQLLDAGRFIARVPLADSTRALTNKLKGLDRLLLENDNIAHERKTNGSGGGKHKFYYANAPQFEELEQSEIDPFSGG